MTAWASIAARAAAAAVIIAACDVDMAVDVRADDVVPAEEEGLDEEEVEDDVDDDAGCRNSVTDQIFGRVGVQGVVVVVVVAVEAVREEEEEEEEGEVAEGGGSLASR